MPVTECLRARHARRAAPYNWWVFDPGSARLAIVIGAADVARRAASEVARTWLSRHPDGLCLPAPTPATWPFLGPPLFDLPAAPVLIWAPDLHEAFVNHQTASTRLVTSQAGYLMQAWLDLAGDRDLLLLATADRTSLARHAPEMLARRGACAAAFVHDADAGAAVAPDGPPVMAPPAPEAAEVPRLLARALRTDDPAERLRLCVDALDRERTPPVLLTSASTCMEVNDLDSAARDLDEALAAAPGWAAAHFERGKLWLRLDDMERASESFRTAARLMPRFAAAWANLGAALGELDRSEEALAAFLEALQADPESHQALNNVGVLHREMGQLQDSEAAFRRVTSLAPDLAFGYYNLGHTLFLQGRYQAALSAYLQGQKRDPERNAVQATRLALCRLATGDAAGALDELQRATRGLPAAYRQQLLDDTSAVAWALLTHRPDLPGWKQVNDWLAAERVK